MKIEIQDSENKVYYVNCNPILEVYHIGAVEVNVHMASGQPVSVQGTVEQDVIDLIYEVYNEFPMEGEPNIAYPTSWSVGYDREGATEVEDLLNSYDFLTVNAIKHPDREEWAIPFHSVIFAAFPDGDVKDQLIAFATSSVTGGNRKTCMEMNEDNWCPDCIVVSPESM